MKCALHCSKLTESFFSGLPHRISRIIAVDVGKETLIEPVSGAEAWRLLFCALLPQTTRLEFMRGIFRRRRIRTNDPLNTVWAGGLRRIPELQFYASLHLRTRVEGHVAANFSHGRDATHDSCQRAISVGNVTGIGIGCERWRGSAE